MEFDKNRMANINTKYFYNTYIINENVYLSYYIDGSKTSGHKFYNIDQMTINMISDMCNMTYEYYIIQPMSMCERQIKMSFARSPHLIKS